MRNRTDAGAAQAFGRDELRGQDAFRIRRAAAVQPAVFDAARKERGHAIEVRGENDGGGIQRGDDVEATVADRLAFDLVAKPLEARVEPFAGGLFRPRRRIDVDQFARKGDRL